MIAFAVPGEDDDVTVYSSTQHPSEVQHMVAHALGVASNAVTVDRAAHGRRLRRQGDAGATCSRRSPRSPPRSCGRAVKIRPDRDDDMIATGKRHDFLIDYEVGFDDDGRHPRRRR